MRIPARRQVTIPQAIRESGLCIPAVGAVSRRLAIGVPEGGRRGASARPGGDGDS